MAIVAMRHPGHAPGDPVDLADAQGRHCAAACWEGTRRPEVTRPVATEQVPVEGVHGPTTGTLAWTTVAQVWTGSSRPADREVLGTQDPDHCR